MQHNIVQALQALQQQKQQRQQQEQVQQQQLVQQQQEQEQQQADMLEPQMWRQHDAACRLEEQHAVDGAGMPASKRLHSGDGLGSGSDGSLLGDAAAAAGGAASVSDDAGMLLDQQHDPSMAYMQQLQHVHQQHMHQLQQQQRSVQQQQAVDSIDLVIEDSQEDPDNASPAIEQHGRAAAAAGHTNMFAAGAGFREEQPWAVAAGSSGGSSELQPGDDSSSMPSGGSSLQQGSGLQSDSIPAARSSGMGGSMMSLGSILSQDVPVLQNAAGALSGQQQQQQQNLDPFGVTGATAAARGVAVSTLSALINSMSSQQQQQQQRSKPPAVPACLQRRTRASRFFKGGGSSSCSPALLGHTTAANAALLQDEGLGLGIGSDPLLTPSGSLPSLPSSGGVLAGVSNSSGLGLSSEAGQGSLSGLGLSSEDDVLAGLGSSRLGQQQQQHVLDQLDEETAVSPPKTHHLALGGSSSHAWGRLQRSLRIGTGLSRRTQQHKEPELNMQQRPQKLQQGKAERDSGVAQHQQQQQLRQQQHAADAAAARGEGQAAVSISSGGGSSSNDENAEPADAGDIHSIAHIKQYAKLANKVVSKVHKQQQQHSTQQQQQQQQRVLTQQQVSPLGLAGSAANAAAAGKQKPSGQTASQPYLRSSKKKGRGDSASKGQQQQQLRKSLTHLYVMQYDPDLLFVPVKPLESPLGLDGEVTGADEANAAAAAEDAMQEDDNECDVLLSGEGPCDVDELRSKPFGQQSRQASRLLGGPAAARLGGGGSGSSSSRAGIAARPFKAPRAAAQDSLFSTSPGDDLDDCGAVDASGFGAFGQFACGGEGEGIGRLAGGRTAGSKRGLGSSWLR
jgi:hypothetical protein